MTRLICGNCQVPVTAQDVACPRCGAPLYEARSGLIVEPDLPLAAPGPSPEPRQVQAPPEPRPVAAAPVPAPPVQAPPVRPGGPAEVAPARPRITIAFETGSIELPPAREILIGRDGSSPVAQFLQWFENVSRGHATMTVEPDGRVWLRDEGSVNGTWVDGKPLRPGHPVMLRDSVRLRLADVDAVVTVLRPGPGLPAGGPHQR